MRLLRLALAAAALASCSPPPEEADEQQPAPLTLAPVDDCVAELRQCNRWCDAVFCSWPSGACSPCYAQCRFEYNLCRLSLTGPGGGP